MLSAWAGIGTHEMHGGAFNWGNLWSGIRNLGGTVKNWGSRLWHSNASRALREQLKKTGLQEKIVEGVSAGIHGAVDLGRQRLERAIEQRLERRPVPDAARDLEDASPEAVAAAEEEAAAEAAAATATAAAAAAAEEKAPLTVALPPKRGLVSTTAVEATPAVAVAEPPPTYEEAVAMPPPPLVAQQSGLRGVPVTQPAQPFTPAVHETERVVAPVPLVTVRRRRGWENTLNDIVGLGVQTLKRRRCY